MTTTDTRGECPNCHRDFALTKKGGLRLHGRFTDCPGSGQPPVRAVNPDARAEAAILRWAAARLCAERADYGPERTPGVDTAAELLSQWADQIYPGPAEEPQS